MLEKRLQAVPAQSFTANGTTDGAVTIAADPCSLFKVKQHIIISATSLPNLSLEVKRIDAGKIFVGPIPDGKPGVNTSIDARTDISAYTVALGAAISANEQKRPAIDWSEAMRAMYEEEPTVAMRSVLVDKCGDKIDKSNPLPVDAVFSGSITVGDVRLTACDNDPVPGDIHSSIRIAGPNCANEMEVESDGSINVNIVGSSGTGFSVFNDISSVPASSNTILLTYTVPVASTLRLTRIDVGGTNIAKYEVYVNAVIFARKRTWHSGPFTETFDFDSYNQLQFLAGDVIQVKVEHVRPFSGDFEARLQGTLV